jgi:hypothetical protein
MRSQLKENEVGKIIYFAQRLINQETAKPIVLPKKASPSFWFGGGNLVEIEGTRYLCGRYRNYGDSRFGTMAGTRGFELAIFKSTDDGNSFEKIHSFSKKDLQHSGLSVISIEGSFLNWNGEEVELYISTEKGGLSYPEGLESHQKPNTGVWTIDRITAKRIEDLNSEDIEEVIRGKDPQYFHIKDPFGYQLSNGDFILFFCTHPYCWTSSNTGYIIRHSGEDGFGRPNYSFFPRGTTWDVAITRGTTLVRVPKVGQLADAPDVSLMFYDGGESFRKIEEHQHALSRPRGYSCEEIGGAAYVLNENIQQIHRLSVNFPMFISPYGLGTSRYVDVLVTDDGYYATWQQSQNDGSQALVMHFLSMAEIGEILK